MDGLLAAVTQICLSKIQPGTFHLSSSRLTGGSVYSRPALVTVISLLSLFFIRLVCHLKSFIAPASYYHTVSSADMHFRVLLLLQSKWCLSCLHEQRGRIFISINGVYVIFLFLCFFYFIANVDICRNILLVA